MTLNEARILSAISNTAWHVYHVGDRRATKFLYPTLTVKATRRHRPRSNERHVEILLTIGRPNHAERESIKQAKLAGEPLPIKRMQLKLWPVKL